MKAILNVARIELQKMFYSPIAWLIIILFAVQTGILFMGILKLHINGNELGMPLFDLTFATYADINTGLLPSIGLNMYLYIPLLTMGLFSHDFSSGSIKLLYSSPVTNLQIVLGKYFSVMAVGAALLMIVVTQVAVGVITIEKVDIPVLLTGLAGLYLLIGVYASIGLFMSSVTSYQIGAAIGTLAILFALNTTGTLWQDFRFVRDVTYWLSINDRTLPMLVGLVRSQDLVYLLLIPALFVSFTVFRLKAIRENSKRSRSFLRYATAFSIVAVLGYISSLPALMKFYDATASGKHTLSPYSQEVMKHVKGKVRLTTYVNLFEFGAVVAPVIQKSDMARYDNFIWAHPDIEYDYKYYYAIPKGDKDANFFAKMFPGLTIPQAVEKAVKIYELDKDLFLPGEAYRKEIDLEAEENTYVVKLESESGKSVLLRNYYDGKRYPEEPQITAAFRNLVMEQPVVAFVKGHQERTLENTGGRSLNHLSINIKSRKALVNNGFDVQQISLTQAVPANVEILVIADAKTPYSPDEIRHLNDFIDRGGNLVISCDKKRQEFMNPLVERLGVRFLPGQIIEKNLRENPELVKAGYTPGGRKLAYHFDHDKMWMGMPGAVSITYDPVKEFKYLPVVISDSVKNIQLIDSSGSWNELKTTDFIDDVASFNPEEGETAGPHIAGLSLTRSIKGKTQKILVFGDTDWFSDELLNSGSNPNPILADGMFYWLSDRKLPIDVRRKSPVDNNISLKKAHEPFLGYLFKIIIPASLLLFFTILWLRRKRR